MSERMDIYSRSGTLVSFAYPTAGYPGDVHTAAKHLTRGTVYTVDFTDVGRSHTDVYLREIPGVAFNSCHFAPFDA